MIPSRTPYQAVALLILALVSGSSGMQAIRKESNARQAVSIGRLGDAVWESKENNTRHSHGTKSGLGTVLALYAKVRKSCQLESKKACTIAGFAVNITKRWRSTLESGFLIRSFVRLGLQSVQDMLTVIENNSQTFLDQAHSVCARNENARLLEDMDLHEIRNLLKQDIANLTSFAQTESDSTRNNGEAMQKFQTSGCLGLTLATSP
jgi:hypothetical protein